MMKIYMEKKIAAGNEGKKIVEEMAKEKEWVIKMGQKERGGREVGIGR